MAKRSPKAATTAIEPDDRTIPGAWISASLVAGEASTSRNNQNTGRDYELVTRGITGTAYRAATINATVLAGQTLRLFRKVGVGMAKAGRKVADRRTLKHATNRGGIKSLIGKAASYASRAGDEVEEVLDHPVLDLIHNPDPIYTGPMWLHQIFWFKEVAGRAYLYVGERGPGGVPVSAYILPSQFAWPMLSDTGFIEGYYYGRNRSAPMRIPSSDVVYLRQHGSPTHPAGGMSWLFSVMAETDMEAAALQSEAQRWLNGGNPGMVFKAAPTTTDAQMKQIHSHLNQSMRGVGKAGSVLLLRDTTLEQYGAKPHEMQYVEGLTTTEKRIYDAAGVPEPIYRLNSANLASATVANAQYMRYTIAPRLAVLASELTELLLPHFGVEPGEMWFCFDDPTQEDQLQLAAELRAGEAQGIVSPNEYRKVLDLEALPDESNVMRYRQTEAPAPGGLGIFGSGLPTPSKAEEMPSDDMGSVDVEAEPATMDASVDTEATSVDEDATPEVEAKAMTTKAESYEPTDAMAEEAKRGLDWRAEYGRGGTEVGVARARDIVNKRNLSLDTVYRMASYFARHEVDKQGQGWNRDEDGYPSAGRIAWALWGGDPGRTWADKIVRQAEADEDGEKAVGGCTACNCSKAMIEPDVKPCDQKPCDTRPRIKVPKRYKAATQWDDETGTPVASVSAYRAFERDMLGWYKTAVPSMVNDAGMAVFPSDEAMADLTKISERFVMAAIITGGKDGMAKIGMDSDAFNVANESAMSYVRNRGLFLASTVPDTLKPHVQAVIEKELAKGTSIAGLRDAIKDMAPDLAEWQAVRIARTETANAYCEGNRLAWQQEGVETKQWITAGGPCAICDAIAAKYPGEIPIGESFDAAGFTGQAPTAHPNCRCDLLPGVEYTDD
jgi:HK97 family phage portal protein